MVDRNPCPGKDNLFLLCVYRDILMTHQDLAKSPSHTIPSLYYILVRLSSL